MRVEGSEETFVHRDHPVPLLVVVQGDEASHRLAEGDDDAALRVDRRDSLGSPGSVEVRGSDLAGSAVLGDLAEVRGVPLEPLLVVAVEEERLLQLGRDHRVGASREVLMEPRRPGSLRTDEHEAQPESSLRRRVNEALGHQTCDRRSSTARSEVSISAGFSIPCRAGLHVSIATRRESRLAIRGRDTLCAGFPPLGGDDRRNSVGLCTREFIYAICGDQPLRREP